MIGFILGSVGVLLGFLGVVINVYILLILALHKKTQSCTELIILHLSSCGLVTSISILSLVAPSIISPDWKECLFWAHELIGTLILILQLLTVWSICALRCFDRCSAISSPLRYTQLITRKRIFFYFLFVWIISIATILILLSLSLLHNPHSQLSPPKSLQNGTKTQNFPGATSTSNNSTTEPEILIGNEATFLPETSDFLPKFSLDYEMIGVLKIESDPSNLIGFEYYSPMGLSLPRVDELNWISGLWLGGWMVVLLVGPAIVLLTSDLIVLSIARRQRHRIVMALYQITLSAQATVTRTQGTQPPPNYWLNNNGGVPPKSRACRAVWEDLGGLICINFPFVLITVMNLFPPNYKEAPDLLCQLAALSFFLGPIFNALLYGIRARPLRTAVKSYLRKRLTNNTLQQEIQKRLSPVDGSPRASTRSRSRRFKSFRSYTNSPNSSGSISPNRRLSVSTNDLRPPPFHHNFPHHIKSSPSHTEIRSNNNMRTLRKQVTVLRRSSSRRVCSFLQLPTSIPIEFQELWSGLRKPPRSPTIIITHEIRLNETKASRTVNNSINSLFSSSSISLPTTPSLTNFDNYHNHLDVEHMV